MKRLFFPLGVMAMKTQDVTDFDVVLMSGTHCAKYVKVSDKALVISYSFTPFRLAWDPMSYAQYAQSKGLKRAIFDKVLNILRGVDFKAAQRPDYYVAMTEETADRLRNSYQIKNPIQLINPPVKANNFYISPKKKDYYLIVSRLETYKKVDLVIEVFNELKYPLIVVGKGLQADEIKAMAGPNVTFYNGLSAEELAELYANCKAFLFPQHEDYGITPLEANASGRPVIAYGVGGVLSTQIPVKDNPAAATAIYFNQQTKKSIIDAVQKFEDIEHQFDSNFIRRHAESFDESRFISRIREFVVEKYSLHKRSTKLVLRNE
ncbi:glycosyltransferase family 4 protein [Spirosoma knui]